MNLNPWLRATAEGAFKAATEEQLRDVAKIAAEADVHRALKLSLALSRAAQRVLRDRDTTLPPGVEHVLALGENEEHGVRSA